MVAIQRAAGDSLLHFLDPGHAMDRAALQQIRADAEQGTRGEDSSTRRSRRHRGRPRLRGREERRYEGPQRLRHRLRRHQAHSFVGHEMGHYVLGHIWKTIIFFSLLNIAVLYAIYRTAGWLINKYRGRFGFTELSDIASLPLIILLFS